MDDINAVYDLIKSQNIVAGSIVGFNAGTPVRTKGEAEQAMAKLTKIAHAYNLDDEEMYKYQNPRTDAERQRVIDAVLLNTAELAQGVNDTKEYIRAKLTYDGKFEYADNRDNVKIEFDLERPEGNNIGSSDWSNHADATPLDDIEEAIEQYKSTNNNAVPAYIVMNSKTYANFKRTQQVKDEIDGAARIVRDSDVELLFSENGYPTLELDDDYTTFENADGSTEDKAHLEDGKVVLHAEVMGQTLSGPSKEGNWAHGLFSYTVISQDPPGEKTIVGEVTLPVSQNYNGNVIMTV